MSPTDSFLSSAIFFGMATPVSVSPANEPATSVMATTCSSAAGSVPRMTFASPSMLAKLALTAAAVLTSGRAVIRPVRVSGRAVAPKLSVVTTYCAVIELSMASTTDTLSDWAVTEMNPTRPTPIMSADAVVAVRLGLRMAFSRAIRLATPPKRAIGHPSSRAIGPAVTGPTTVNPMNTRKAPKPTSCRPASVLP